MLIRVSEKMRFISDSTPGMLRWTCSKRCLPGWAGSATSGKLTDEVLVPLSLYLTSFSATSRPILACASTVEPPIWGVRITLSRPRSGDRNSSWLLRGSTGNTSIAAPNSPPRPAGRLGQPRQLRADGAVADDAQGLAPDLIRLVGRLEPAATVGRRVLCRNPAQQQNGL